MNPAYLILLSFIGFCVSFYLYYSKTLNKKLYCVIGESCDEVVKSKWGKTFGIENTLPGMFYYALIFFYGVAMLTNQYIFKLSIVYYSIVSISIMTVLFSAYLVIIQAFVLKKWCEYCIVSSISSVIILLVLIS